MGAVHDAVNEMAADTGDPFLPVEGAAHPLSVAHAERPVALQAILARRITRSLEKGSAGGGLRMHAALPFQVLLNVTGAAGTGCRSGLA